MRQEATIEGMKYVLEGMSFGKDLDGSESAIEIEVIGDKPVPNIDMKKLQFNTLLNALVSWEFKGLDENGKFKKDGDVLSLTEENIRELPAPHGLALQKIAMELNSPAEVEVKNL